MNLSHLYICLLALSNLTHCMILVVTVCRLFFSSHWYGFLPTIESGSATIINKVSNHHVFDLINLASYREQVRQMTSGSRGRLPYDIRLKSVNDFVQSVITSTIGDDPYNWVICEGSSEKIYLNKYFEDLIESNKLRIVPVVVRRK